MEINVTCNTPDEVLFQNIEINSRRDLEWITEVPAHDGHAVIVGGGPSVADQIESIRWRQSLGQKVFALNGAATFLKLAEIDPDYQVILDARVGNALLVGNAYLFLLASQCDKSVVDTSIATGKPVQLWHPKIEGIEDHLPDKREDLTLIGGGISVGLSAMCLAYSMGYRKIHLYGYDSSQKDGAKHAYDQPMNAGEDVVEVTVYGKTFKTSLTMAKQAEGFQAVCDQLIDLGCVVTVDGDGLLPFMVRENARRAALDPQTEREKYEAMWTLAEYRAVAPGEHVAEAFAEISKVGKDDIVIDFGCGTGRGAKKVHDLTGCDLILVDFTDNSLDESVKTGDWFTFYRHDLTQPLEISSKYGFCTDVMEHIPPDDVETVIQNIMRASERVFFQISLVDDACGALIGRPLHLSVHPFDWWKEKFLAMGYRIEWSQDCGESALFYIAR
jgi:SAM-dependent methyltransferase